MLTRDFFWEYFKRTGRIGAYLIFRTLLEEDIYSASSENSKEEKSR